jgi:GNAT superfamily N-acetyltransferase
MTRLSVMVRDAELDDAAVLASLWSDVLRKVDRAEQAADLELVIKTASASAEQRFVVAERDGRLAGAVYMRLTTLSPLNLEPCVQAIQPRVFDEFRRQGVGRALMDATATFAEEHGVLHMNTVVPATSRDTQRFAARLGLAAAATYRVAPVGLVRSRLASHPGATGLPRVVAARRSQRRARGSEPVVLPDEIHPVAPEQGR